MKKYHVTLVYTTYAHYEFEAQDEDQAEQMAWAIGIVVIVMFLGAVGWGIAEIQDLCAKTRCGR